VNSSVAGVAETLRGAIHSARVAGIPSSTDGPMQFPPMAATDAA
jgi:hypothetical protein